MRILYLDLDTLRPDHLGCYGYHRNTSPNIDSVAKDAVRFENYYCSDAPCLPSRNALMTGRFGIHSGVVGHGGTAADMRREGYSRDFCDKLNISSLPGFLRRQGLRTVLVSPFAERHSCWQFYAGFSEMYNTGRQGGESADEISPVALDWLERNAEKDNWYLHVNFWDAHTPYRAPLSFGEPFANDPLPDWITDEVLAEHVRHVGPHSAREIGMYNSNENPNVPRHPGEVVDRKGLRRMFDGYDTGILYMDTHIGYILDALKRAEVYNDTAIIISADHAENIGELGLYGEHATADYVNCRIPMIIKWPGGKIGTDENLHYNLDLLPTYAELLGGKKHPLWDGESFADCVVPDAAVPSKRRDYLVLSQCAHLCQRGVRFGNYIYLRTYHDGYHLYPKEMLFNIKNDPHEQFNLAEKERSLCEKAVYYLNEWHDEMMLTMPDDVDPLWTVMREGGPYHTRGHLEQYCKRLEETDRAEGAAELRRRHPNEK
ncbi:MAG: sulfatase [Clostridia bacterium]|nr:sulfatase [Clostridia bacterium]